jgi:hypothetical protein
VRDRRFSRKVSSEFRSSSRSDSISNTFDISDLSAKKWILINKLSRVCGTNPRNSLRLLLRCTCPFVWINALMSKFIYFCNKYFNSEIFNFPLLFLKTELTVLLHIEEPRTKKNQIRFIIHLRFMSSLDFYLGHQV